LFADLLGEHRLSAPEWLCLSKPVQAKFRFGIRNKKTAGIAPGGLDFF
jgi:hypothetical protein